MAVRMFGIVCPDIIVISPLRALVQSLILSHPFSIKECYKLSSILSIKVLYPPE